MRGHWNFCENKAGTEVGLDYDGSFAEHMVLPGRFVHRIPEGMSFDRAVVIEPLACVLNNVRATRVQAEDAVCILGAGPMGVLSAMVCRLFGASVTLVEPDTHRRDLAAQILGFAPDPIRIVTEPSSAQFDVVLDTVGSQLEAALRVAANRGRVGIVGFNDKATATVAPLSILQRGLTIIGAGDYSGSIFPEAISLADRLPLERLVTHRFPLAAHENAFEALSATTDANGYGAMKVVLQSWAGAS
jgi:threonine dehydrogenase-like Zn-dependent dehydrogenase